MKKTPQYSTLEELGISLQRLVGHRCPVEKRFWAVANENGNLYPSSVSHHRSLAKQRFLDPGRYGYHGSWAQAKRQGWSLHRVAIVVLPDTRMTQ